MKNHIHSGGEIALSTLLLVSLIFVIPVSPDPRFIPEALAFAEGAEGGTDSPGSAGEGVSNEGADSGVGPGSSSDPGSPDADPGGATADAPTGTNDDAQIGFSETAEDDEGIDANEETGFFDAIGGFISGVVDALGGIVGVVAGVVGVAVSGVVGLVGVAANAVSTATTGKGIAENAFDAVMGFFSEEDASLAGGIDSGVNAGLEGDPAEPDPSESGGNETSNTSLFPRAPLAPSIQFFANKEVLSSGESLTLTWNVANAESCRALDAWSGERELSGSEEIVNVTESRTYTLSCIDENDALKARTLFITVIDGLEHTLPSFSDNEEVEKLVNEAVAESSGVDLPDPALDLAVEPTSPLHGQSVLLKWSAQNAIVCVGGDDWPRPQGLSVNEKNYAAISGQKTIFHVTSDHRFTLVCFAADGGRIGKSVSITVRTLPQQSQQQPTP